MAATKRLTGISGGFLVSELVWLTATKAVVCLSIPFGVSPAAQIVKLYVSNDAGLTWSVVSQSEIQLNGVSDQNGVTAGRYNMVRDSSNNIYLYERCNQKLVKFTKGAGDVWTPTSYTITNLSFAESGLLFAHGVNNLTLITNEPNAYGPAVFKYTTTNLTSWTKTAIAQSSNGNNVRYYRSGDLVGGAVEVMYASQGGLDPAVISHGDFSGYDQYFRPSEMAMAVTNDGKTHIVYCDFEEGATSGNIKHQTKTGGTWSVEQQVAAISNFNSDDAVTYFRQDLMLATDGVGLFAMWVEYNTSTRVYTLKTVFWDGATWGSIQTLESMSAEADNDYYWHAFKLVGPFARNSVESGKIPFQFNRSGNNYWELSQVYAPFVPTQLAPINGNATSDLTPNVSWQFNGVSGDSQSAYQVIVYRQSDSVVMYDSGKVTSSVNNIDIPGGANLAFGVFYQWKVRLWGSTDLPSSYSSLALFKTSEAPVVTITEPDDLDVVTTDAPTIEWTYADPESTAQQSYRIEVTNAADTAVIYDSGDTAGADLEFTIPSGFLENDTTYNLRVYATDSDGVVGTSDPVEFDVSFIAPPVPTVVGSVDSNAIVDLDITLNPPAVDSFDAEVVNIYRRKETETTWEPVELNVPIGLTVVDNCDATTGWSESGVGTAPDVTTDAKEGSNAIELGASGAGDAIYSKTLSLGSIVNYNQLRMWLYVTDKTSFATLRVKYGQDSSNYYYFDTDADDFTDLAWNSVYKDFNDISITGSPNSNSLTYIRIELLGATGAIASGDVRMDFIRLINNQIDYLDYTAPNGSSYVYGVTVKNIQENLESSRGLTSALAISFPERLNTFLIPTNDPENYVKSFMDGTDVPNWVDNTETKYFQTKGAQKPIAFISGVQDFKEGKIDLRFFDVELGGEGLDGIKDLESIRNTKPLLLKTWWGENYYISINGKLTVARKPGIGWYATFDFTEISND